MKDNQSEDPELDTSDVHHANAVLRQALEDNWDELMTVIRSMLWGRTDDGDIKKAALDIVASLLLKLETKKVSYDADKGLPLPWLIGVAKKIIKVELPGREKRHRDKYQLIAENKQEDGVQTDDDLFSQLNNHNDGERYAAKLDLKRILDLDVHNDYQHLLELFYLEDLSIEELAEKLGKAKGAVKVQLYRARNYYREKLPRFGEELRQNHT